MSDGTMIVKEIKPVASRLVKRARDLEVYKRAYRAAMQIHEATLNFPKIEQYALADQLRRSSKGICANISEGFTKQKYSVAEFGRFLAMGEGSAGEVQVWLQFAYDLGYIDQKQFAGWEDDYLAILSMLSNLRVRL